MSQLNYDANPEDQERSVEAVPVGEYTAIIEASEYTSNKQGTGKILKLTYLVIDGPLKGRKIFENLNLENQSSQAETISRQALNSICVATDVLHVKDSTELHDIPMKIDVSVKNDPKYGVQNRIKKHKAMNEKPNVVHQDEKGNVVEAPVDPGTAEKSTSDGKHPWEK